MHVCCGLRAIVVKATGLFTGSKICVYGEIHAWYVCACNLVAYAGYLGYVGCGIWDIYQICGIWDMGDMWDLGYMWDMCTCGICGIHGICGYVSRTHTGSNQHVGG